MGESIRLQKILAQAGCGSRRACEVFITDGRVSVDGVVVRQLGSKADPETQTIELDNVKVAGPGKLAKSVRQSGEHVYWILNKPKGVLCTNEDPSGRPLAVQMVPEKRRVFCVGRLDKDTEGLILLTNDGELTNQLTHPRYGVEKVYLARVDGRAMPQQIAKLERGVHLAEGKTRGARVRVRKAAGSQSLLEIHISEGMNRQVRRMLAAVGLYCRGLKRVSVGPVRLGEMGVGESRQLSTEELDRLRAAIRNAQQESEKPAPSYSDVADEDTDVDEAAPKKKKDRTSRDGAGDEPVRKRAEQTEKPARRKKSFPSEDVQDELEELDEASGTRTAMSPVAEDGSTTQVAPAVSEVAGDATQAAEAIAAELEGDDSDDDTSEFSLDDDDLAEAETAPHAAVAAGDDDDVEEDNDEDEDEDEDEESEVEDDDADADDDNESDDADEELVVLRKKDLNAAAALDEDADTADVSTEVADEDDAFDDANPVGGGAGRKWADRGDADDPEMNAAAAEKEHRREERESRKRQTKSAVPAGKSSPAGKPRRDERRDGRGERRDGGERRPREFKSRGYGNQGGERERRPYDRERAGDRAARPAGAKFGGGPRKSGPAYDRRKTWGEVAGKGGERTERDSRGAERGERRYDRPRDGERSKSGDRGGDRGGERSNWKSSSGPRKQWTPRGDRNDRPRQERPARPYQDRREGAGSGGAAGGDRREWRERRDARGGAERGGGQNRSGPRPAWRGSGGGGERRAERGGDRPRGNRPSGDRPRGNRDSGDRKFAPRPWEKREGRGSGGAGGVGGERQTRPWEKRPRKEGSEE